MIGARRGAPAIPVYLDRGCSFAHQLLSTNLPRSLYRPLLSSSFNYLSCVLPSRSSPILSSFTRLSSSSGMPSTNDGNRDSGAASSAPMGQASSSWPARALSSPQFSRVFGGAHSHSAPPPSAQESEDPLGTLGAPAARAPLLEGAHFAEWARRSRCNLSYSMLEVLNDDAWDIWRVSQVTSGLNGAPRALVRLCQGAYQVPRSARCDRAFVRDPNAAGFIAAASSFLFHDGDVVPMYPSPFVDWGQRLPSYSAAASADNSRLRARNSFAWAMISEMVGWSSPTKIGRLARVSPLAPPSRPWTSPRCSSAG